MSSSSPLRLTNVHRLVAHPRSQHRPRLAAIRFDQRSSSPGISMVRDDMDKRPGQTMTVYKIDNADASPTAGGLVERLRVSIYKGGGFVYIKPIMMAGNRCT